MRKADIIQSISNKTKLHKVDVLVAIEEFCKEVKLSLEQGHAVHIRGFGSFVINKKVSKKQSVPGDTVYKQIRPGFIPAAEFIDCVKRCDSSLLAKSNTDND
ncbi:HU family DNA-binding protein [Taibaiella soli]|uniref:Integration host factor subunit beta n=1 Tax=Taibaiella soli TaxID=1649169 RepID=A0A2W2B536_9BACT|nr:HU family DNA-binding protein [Taibaiella soli]PZF71339.1 integration host factor subunit beta [Taibaiella soli]